ncbi:hypothetical protein AGR8A_pAt30091 [Agrobacterium fabrum str. J-07]|nr:hypothetical protein AGR8A_pAt30091 [Agrobacterium fabrum str. J-07]
MSHLGYRCAEVSSDNPDMGSPAFGGECAIARIRGAKTIHFGTECRNEDAQSRTDRVY